MVNETKIVPNTFLIFEEWASAAALARHFQTEHMEWFSAQLPGLLAGEMAVHRYEVASVTPL